MTTAILRFNCGHESLIKGSCEFAELVTFARENPCPCCVRKKMAAPLPTNPKPPNPEEF